MTKETKIESQGAVEQTDSILEQAIEATKQTDRTYAEDLLKTLTENALSGTVKWNKSFISTIEETVKLLDQKLSVQLANVMHADEFKKLEGSWRGLKHLVFNSSTGTSLKIRMLNASKEDIDKDFKRAPEFDQSLIFKQTYEENFGTAGGEPYSVLVGDYEFDRKPQDLNILKNMSQVAAAGFCPFITAAGSELMGLENWSELSKPRDLAKIFNGPEYAQWRGLRDSEDSRFLVLTMPRTLARLPYGENTLPAEGFGYEELQNADGSVSERLEHDDYCWMNSAYVLAERITNAFSIYGWTTAIRGAEGGGKVEGLPLHSFLSTEGDMENKCPTEIAITDRREHELSKLGFLPLCHYKDTDYAVFFGAQTVQEPKKYDTPQATDNAAISARLPYILATSRFAHYLKVMARDKIGSFMEASDCEAWLNRWIKKYVNANAATNQDLKSRLPLADARVEVQEIPGQPGAYHAIAYLRPWLQFEELTTSMRLVARIPTAK